MTAATKPSGASGTGVLQIGDWLVEPQLNRLAFAGESVRIEPKAMETLVYLADRPGVVVSRSELLAAIWPDVIVGDDSLTQVVIKLRKALKDLADEPTYIQTISKRGYRLIAPVLRRQDVPVEAQSPVAAPLRAGRDRLVAWMALGGVAAALLVVAGIHWVTGESDVDIGLAAIPTTVAASVRSTRPMVAISPFEALGGGQEEELLAQGITTDLVTDLSKVFGLWIVGAAPMDFRSTGEPVARIDYQVTGSVQRTDRQLRLHVRLTDARTGELLWSERFERAPDDLFAIQEELGPRILAALPAKVSEIEMRRVARRHTRNLAAYESFLRGQRALLTRQKAENENARELFRRAIRLDASFARAYAALALTYAADYRNQWTSDGDAALNRAAEFANTANQIDPDVPETYWALAFVHMERRQHAKALRFVETAVRLNPSYADGYGLIGGILTYIGRPADTLVYVRAAIRLDPQAGHLHFLILGRAYLFLGDLEQARVNLDQATARNHANLEAHLYTAALYVMSGDRAAAAWEAEEIRSLRPGFSAGNWLRTYPMTDVAQKAKLANALGELGF